MALPGSIISSITKVAEAAVIAARTAALDAEYKSSGGIVIEDMVKYAQYQILDMWCWNACGSAIVDKMTSNTSAPTTGTQQCTNATTYLASKGASDCCSLTPGGHSMAAINPLMILGTALHYSSSNKCNHGGAPQWVVNGNPDLTASWTLLYQHAEFGRGRQH